MAVKCILTGQTPSVLDGVTENVQTQIDNKVDKVTGKGLSTEDYTTVEKTKLSGIEEGAQKNTVTSVAGKTGAVTLAASDVGAQPKITVTGILQGDGNGNITAVESIGAEIVTLDKADVGLGNVDNTSDADKPISTATQTALDAKQSSITAKGVLKGDGEGNVTAAEEAEVELVELTADSIGAAPKPRILNITLPAANWTGSGPYTQTVTIANGTANTKVDIMFDDTVYQQMVDDQVGYLAIANENRTFTAKAKGGQPSADLSIQVECKEVTPPPSLKPELSGTYLFNAELTVPILSDGRPLVDGTNDALSVGASPIFITNSTFECGGVSYESMGFQNNRLESKGTPRFTFIYSPVSGNDSRVYNPTIDQDDGWSNESYRTVIFTTPFPRSSNTWFYDWFILNTTKQS